MGQLHGPDDSQEGPGQKQLPALAPRGSRGCGTTELRESRTSRHTHSHPHPHPGIGLEEEGPAPQLPAGCRGGWGWGATSSVTSGLGSATGAAVGKYSAATHRLRGPRRPTWCGRWVGSRPQPTGTLRDLSGCRPPGGAPGCVQFPGGVPPRQAQPPPLPPPSAPCWAGQIRSSRARSLRDWWINLGTALPCPQPLWQTQKVAGETAAPLGTQSGCETPLCKPGTPECLQALSRGLVPPPQ